MRRTYADAQKRRSSSPALVQALGRIRGMREEKPASPIVECGPGDRVILALHGVYVNAVVQEPTRWDDRRKLRVLKGGGGRIVVSRAVVVKVEA